MPTLNTSAIASRPDAGHSGTTTTADVDRFLACPPEYFDYSLTRMMTLPRDALADLQLGALKQRFAQFRHALPMVERLADIQGIDRIDKLEDVLPLLFDHTTYKSYPASLLQNKRFDQLTKWLNKLTTIDLSKVDTSACRGVDDWLVTLKRETPLTIIHTSGTSGTMSFLPWSKRDWRTNARQLVTLFCQEFGDKDKPAQKMPLNIPCIYPYFRDGGSAQYAINDHLVELIAGGEQNFHALYPERSSADLMLLAAKHRAAAAKGQLDRLEISPDLESRRAEFEKFQRDNPKRVAEFLDEATSRLAGQRIFMITLSSLLLAMAENGLKKGLRNMFSPDSIILSGGGGKGMVLPDDWQEPVKEFFGVKRIVMLYSMSEMAAQFPMCEHGHYHSPPSVISFILDPDTAKPLPRTGTVTGRYAFYDLIPDARWGGFITGDEVTMSWDDPCPCGRTSPYLHGTIQRFKDKANPGAGEEKINCAATPAAYDEALDFLNETTTA